jgi:hypothetical protein
LEGDSNSRYFHNIENGRHKKKLIQSLVQDEGTIEGHEQLKAYVTDYYKGLFEDPYETILAMDQTQIDDIPQVSNEENVFLCPLF